MNTRAWYSVLPLALALAGCVPAAGQSNGETNTDDALDKADRPILYRMEYTSTSPDHDFKFTCAAGRPCTMQVAAQFDAWTLHKARSTGGAMPLLQMIIMGCGSQYGLCTNADLGWDGKQPNGVYTSSQLQAGTYTVRVSRADGLASPDFDSMPVQFCIGSPSAGCDMLAKSTIPPMGMKLGGTITRYVPLDILAGTGSTEAAVDESVELVNTDGSPIAGWLRTTTDGSGAWTLGNILPGNYALRVAGSLYPVTVNVHDNVQTADDIQL